MTTYGDIATIILVLLLPVIIASIGGALISGLGHLIVASTNGRPLDIKANVDRFPPDDVQAPSTEPEEIKIAAAIMEFVRPLDDL